MFQDKFDSTIASWIKYVSEKNELSPQSISLKTDQNPIQTQTRKNNDNDNKTPVSVSFNLISDEKSSLIPYNCLTCKEKDGKIINIYTTIREVQYMITLRRRGCHQLAIALSSSLENVYLVREIFNKQDIFRPEASRISNSIKNINTNAEDRSTFVLSFRYELQESQDFEIVETINVKPEIEVN